MNYLKASLRVTRWWKGGLLGFFGQVRLEFFYLGLDIIYECLLIDASVSVAPSIVAEATDGVGRLTVMFFGYS